MTWGEFKKIMDDSGVRDCDLVTFNTEANDANDIVMNVTTMIDEIREMNEHMMNM